LTHREKPVTNFALSNFNVYRYAAVYIATDNDKEIRAAAPASPRRLVRQLRSPADSGEDWIVRRLRVQREEGGTVKGAAGAGVEGEVEDVDAVEEDAADTAAAAAAEETRCANCGKCSAKNRACRGGAVRV
jgi:hypothetical protein